MTEQMLMFDANRVEHMTAQQAMSACSESEQAIVQKGRFYVVSSSDMPEPPYAILGRDKQLEKECILTTLSFSGGRQSTWCLEAILRGEMPTPENFMVVTADTGVERKRTYRVIDEYKQKCEAAGILMVVADGPNMGQDLRMMQSGEKTRIDNPPLFTRAIGDEVMPEEEYDEIQNGQGITFQTFRDIEDGLEQVFNKTGRRYKPTREMIRGKGQLMQCCTGYYKVAPIRRAIRARLNEIMGSGTTWPGIAETYIGFASHEWGRAVKANEDVQWQKLRFPMIEHDVSANRVMSDWKRWELKSPAISMCKNCPFSGMKRLKEMHDGAELFNDRWDLDSLWGELSDEEKQDAEDCHEDWWESVELDLLLRRFPNAGVKNEVYTNQSLMPLPVLASLGFRVDDKLINEEMQCDSGLCFM
jgi:hypothetical protein